MPNRRDHVTSSCGHLSPPSTSTPRPSSLGWVGIRGERKNHQEKPSIPPESLKPLPFAPGWVRILRVLLPQFAAVYLNLSSIGIRNHAVLEFPVLPRNKIGKLSSALLSFRLAECLLVVKRIGNHELSSRSVEAGLQHLHHLQQWEKPSCVISYYKLFSLHFLVFIRELDIPGEVYERKSYEFEFSTVEMPYEKYSGVNVRLRYVLKVTINRGYAGSIMEYQDFVVRNYQPSASINDSIKMEVGIEDCLHIEFEYNKSKYHLKDVIIGKIYFLLVRIKIKNMDLEIRRRESTGSGANTHVQTETLAKFELMDGAPIRGESIPIRLFLSPYELTPTQRNVNNKFSVKYYLNLVLVDEEDCRYFKQQEVVIYLQQETQMGSAQSLSKIRCRHREEKILCVNSVLDWCHLLGPEMKYEISGSSTIGSFLCYTANNRKG
ncbi:hypothetical protein MLD38_025727 [Melastoma candidum]|uniref:Uncharacterized protein n=1 Tax=Melastoma candidum TaxID=119954 RepID=A0ACB9NZF1_9MYRT|nr:hypothetical protein MLD38_025727 [Melastoma candidum]